MTKKPSVHLIDPRYVEDLGRVLDNGKEKYPDTPWQQVKKENNIASLFRHLLKIMKGEVYDEESGLQHAAHIGVRAMMLHHSIRKGFVEVISKAATETEAPTTSPLTKEQQREEKRAILKQKIQEKVNRLFYMHKPHVVTRVIIDNYSIDALPNDPKEFIVILDILNHPTGDLYTFVARTLSGPRPIEVMAYVRIKEEEDIRKIQLSVLKLKVQDFLNNNSVDRYKNFVVEDISFDDPRVRLEKIPVDSDVFTVAPFYFITTHDGSIIENTEHLFTVKINCPMDAPYDIRNFHVRVKLKRKE